MFQRLGRVLKKEKARIGQNLKKRGTPNSADAARKKDAALGLLRTSYKALLQVRLF